MLQPPASRAPIPIRTPPSTAARAVRRAMPRCRAQVPPSAAATAAPIMMPRSVRLVLSARTGPASISAFPGRCHHVQFSGWPPRAPTSSEPQRLKALVTPQAPPDTSRTPAPSRASTRAPAASGHEPRSARSAAPRAEGTAPSGGGLRRACTRRETRTTSTRARMVTAHEPNQPMWSDRTTGSQAGRSFHRSNCQAASVAPAMKPPRVSTIDVCPEPTAKRVPEAQAPPSCMPIAKSAEPTNRPTPIVPAEGRAARRTPRSPCR